jgi:hypothetical protein
MITLGHLRSQAEGMGLGLQEMGFLKPNGMNEAELAL